MEYSQVSNNRVIPTLLKWRIIFSGDNMRAGIIFFLMGSFFSVIFVSQADFSGWQFSPANIITTSGKIDSMTPTDTSINKRKVFQYDYTFNIGEKSYMGTSYSDLSNQTTNSTVKIEYLKDNPGISRIKNMRRNTSPLWTLFVLIFPIVGLIFILLDTKRNLLAVRLLANGKLTKGSCIEQYATGSSTGGYSNSQFSGNRREFAFIYTFDIDGKKYTTVAKSFDRARMTDEAQEIILYNPSDPEKSIVVDSLPFQVKNYINTHQQLF